MLDPIDSDPFERLLKGGCILATCRPEDHRWHAKWVRDDGVVVSSSLGTSPADAVSNLRPVIDDEPASAEEPLELGAALRAARLKAGHELADVAKATMIYPRYLDAMERDRLEELPEGLYGRSFLRMYVAFLGLDEERFAAEHKRRFPQSDDELFAQSTALRPRRPARVRAAIAVAVAALGFGWWQLAHTSPVAAAPPRACDACGTNVSS
jgi:hypothetical protein